MFWLLEPDIQNVQKINARDPNILFLEGNEKSINLEKNINPNAITTKLSSCGDDGGEHVQTF